MWTEGRGIGSETIPIEDKRDRELRISIGSPPEQIGDGEYGLYHSVVELKQCM